MIDKDREFWYNVRMSHGAVFRQRGKANVPYTAVKLLGSRDRYIRERLNRTVGSGGSVRHGPLF